MSSFLQRHERTKHGTGYSDSAETYFRDSLAMMDQLNNSNVQTLFAENIGKQLTADQVRGAFDRSFGKGAGKKVKFRCSSGMITELWINLKGSMQTDKTLTRLLAAGADADIGCQAGMVDAVGF